MDESTQQAVQLGVNLTIFIVALSISITLLIGVRNVAEKAFEYDATISTGARVLSVESKEKRIVSGNELLSYYANYMTNINNMEPTRYTLTIENKSGSISITKGQNVNLLTSGISLTSSYEVIVEKYRESEDLLYIKLKEI